MTGTLDQETNNDGPIPEKGVLDHQQGIWFTDNIFQLEILLSLNGWPPVSSNGISSELKALSGKLPVTEMVLLTTPSMRFENYFSEDSKLVQT